MERVASNKYLIFFLLVVNSSCNIKNNSNLSYSLSCDTLFLGVVKQSVSIEKSISLINYTNKKIKLLNIKSSCGCTTTAFSDSLINGYDSIAIHIKYIPAMAKDSGDVRKYVTIRTNSSPDFVNLTIKATVIK